MPVDSVPTDSLTAALPDSTPAADSTEVAPPVEVAPTTGHLNVVGATSDASLWINDRYVFEMQNDLRPGRYVIRVAAPGYEAYEATVQVSLGDTLVHRVTLVVETPEFQCDRFGQADYNKNNGCFDVPPRPMAGATTLISLTGRVPQMPRQPAVLAVQVRPDGTPGTVIIHEPSDVAQFTLLAIQFAETVRFEPATKDGRPVVGWTTVTFYPER
jgi:hypothetical protein